MWPAHEPGVLLKLHRRHEAGLGEARTSASALLVMAEHSGTHIDALCHQAENLSMHGGVEVDAQVQTPEGFTQLGIDTVPPLFARGVLLDCADAGHAIGAEALERAAEGLDIAPGDVILIRTGAGALWDDREAFRPPAGSTRAARAGAPTRWPVAVGADNMAWDVPGEDDRSSARSPAPDPAGARGHLHHRGAQPRGAPRDGVREFAFACLPLKLRGGTGSPVRPIALV